MINRILVTTDGSPASNRAVDLAAYEAITHDASQGANSLLIAETGSGNITSGTDPWAKITLAQTTVAAGEMLLVGVDNDISIFGSHLTYGQVILEFSP